MKHHTISQSFLSSAGVLFRIGNQLYQKPFMVVEGTYMYILCQILHRHIGHIR